MNLPKHILLSDLLQHRVRCDHGVDHGPGVTAWMHPPVHRLLGWVSRPSAFRTVRDVWRLDQVRGINEQEVFVKGFPSVSDQLTLDRLPTLLDADLFDDGGHRLGLVADLVFVPSTGEILQYLVSRTDPRLPGTSRWRLTIDRIIDQQPGKVFTSLSCLDDLPLAHSSLRQNFIRRSRHLQEQFNLITDRATSRLEGWLDDPPWESSVEGHSESSDLFENDPLEDWEDQPINNISESNEVFKNRYPRERKTASKDDPWF